MPESHGHDYHRAHCKPRKHPRPVKPTATISGWFGQKVDSTHATVTITGEGFGNVAGSVKLIAHGLGSKVAPIISWTENAIVVIAPVNKVIASATVFVLDERGKDKKAVTTPKKDVRSTNTAAPTWTVATIDDSELAITITGTDLADVEDVFLYDNDAVQFIEAAAFALDGDDLVIEWPASFVSPIVTIVLSDGNGGNITEDNPTPSLDPAANGILTDVSTSVVGSSSVVSLIGSGLGETAGSVVLVKVGGELEDVSVISNGWSNTVVQVAATPSTDYESVILTRNDSEVATLAASFPASFTSAATANPEITLVSGDADALQIDGGGFDNFVRFQLVIDNEFFPFLAIDYSWSPGFVVRSATSVVLSSIKQLMIDQGAQNGTYTIPSVELRSTSNVLYDTDDLSSIGGPIVINIP